MQEIIIDIDAYGNTTVEAKGIAGPDCEKLTAEIESALGDIKKKKRTPEFQLRPMANTRKAGN